MCDINRHNLSDQSELIYYSIHLQGSIQIKGYFGQVMLTQILVLFDFLRFGRNHCNFWIIHENKFTHEFPPL